MMTAASCRLAKHNSSDLTTARQHLAIVSSFLCSFIMSGFALLRPPLLQQPPEHCLSSYGLDVLHTLTTDVEIVTR